MKILINGLTGEVTPPQQYGGIERVNAFLVKGLRELGYDPKFICKTGSSIDCDKIMFPAYQDGTRLLQAAESKWGTFDVYHDSSCAGPLHHAVKHIRPSFWTVHGIGGDGELCAYLTEGSMRLSPLSVQGDLPYTWLGIDLSRYEPCYNKDDFILFIGQAVNNRKYLHYFTAVAKAHRLKAIAIIPPSAVDKVYFDRCQKEWPFEWIPGANDELKLKYLRKAKCLVHCSHTGVDGDEWQDASPVAVHESLAVGTPVIGNYSGGIPEIIEDGHTGFLVARVEEAIEAYRKIRDIRPEDCREYMESVRNHQIFARRIVALYRGIANMPYAERVQRICQVQPAIRAVTNWEPECV